MEATLPAPPEVVWQLITDWERQGDWMLEASDFVVLEDGVEQKVIGLDYLGSRAAAPVTTVVEAPTAAPEPVAAPPATTSTSIIS